MGVSWFANQLKCQHCIKTHGTTQWPANGDQVPFYFQKEPGRHTLGVICPHCQKRWYVVWDGDPGPIEPVIALKR
jgi:Zn finger protein HypA/HybF involved in hydrogenase expression